MLDKQVAIDGKLLDSSHGPTSRLPRESSFADAAARAAAGQLGIFSPAGVACSAKGPAWTRGELEPPQGAKRAASGLAAAVYTPEQQERLGVDEAGADTCGGDIEASSDSSPSSSLRKKDEPGRENRVHRGQGGNGEQELPKVAFRAKESIAQP